MRRKECKRMRSDRRMRMTTIRGDTGEEEREDEVGG
jgi:hypothetical protein